MSLLVESREDCECFLCTPHIVAVDDAALQQLLRARLQQLLQQWLLHARPVLLLPLALGVLLLLLALLLGEARGDVGEGALGPEVADDVAEGLRRVGVLHRLLDGRDEGGVAVLDRDERHHQQRRVRAKDVRERRERLAQVRPRVPCKRRRHKRPWVKRSSWCCCSCSNCCR